MRILFLCKHYHIANTPCRTVGVHPELRNGEHTWVRALAAPEAPARDLRFDLRTETLEDLLGRYPDGEPDVVLVWEPGYQSLPRGIDRSPVPVVACYSDWNLVNPSQRGMLETFDYLFTDRPGLRILEQMGFQNAEFFPMWGHDPGVSRVIPGVEKRWDIGMVGNLNAQVQRERAGWLARVARLAERYRVRIAGGVYGEEYTRMINATKITFNRSIRGEMNMRCFEAAACGSLLFYDEENEEIRDFFEDGVHCVLYNERNLEELLEHYLAHDEERERIVQAARERVAQISFPKNLNRLAGRLEDMDLPSLAGRRRIHSVPEAEVRLRQARQGIGWETLGCDEAALAAARAALDAHPDHPDVVNDYAVTCAQVLAHTQDPERRRAITQESLSRMRRAVELEPGSAFFKLNLAHMYAELGQVEAGIDFAQQALEVLGQGQREPADAHCLPFPYRWEEYRIQYSTLYNAAVLAPEAFDSLRHLLLLHRAGMLLGRLARDHGLRELSEAAYRIAAQARPDLGSGHVALAGLLADRGAFREALAHLKVGLEQDPFLTEGWVPYARLLVEVGQEGEARRFIRRHLCISEAVAPPSERWAMTGTVMELDTARRGLETLLAELDGEAVEEEALEASHV